MNFSNQKGTLLIALIITMTVIAGLGATLLSINTISTYKEIQFNHFTQSRYLAEFGVRYAMLRELPHGTDAVYTLSNPRHKIHIVRTSNTITTTGIVNEGKTFESRINSVYYSSSFPPIPGGISYWNFDDDTDPGKDIWSDYDGTLKGGKTWTQVIIGGQVGDGALELDGNDYLETSLQPDTVIGNNAPFTITLWAYPQNLSPQTLMGTTDGANHLSLGINTAKWYWEYGNVSETTIINAMATEWQHVALIYNGTHIQVYVNGYESIAYNYSGTATLPGANLFIGAKNNGADIAEDFFKGWLDEIAIFNRALSLCEIREIYNAACNAGCDAVAYYPFNGNAKDESGLDQMGYGNDGTPEGALPTKDRFDCPHKAYAFDGTDDYIHIPDNNKADLADEGSLAAWIYLDTVKHSGILHKGNETDMSDEAYGLQLMADGTIELCLNDGTTQHTLTSTTVFNLNQWYHVAATWTVILTPPPSTTSIKLYVNGVEENSLLVMPDFSVRDTSGELNIGSRFASGEYFDGIIDDVVIYDKALTDAEIAEMALERL